MSFVDKLEKRSDISTDDSLSLRDRNKNKRRKRILEATAQLVCEEGVDAVKLARVADMAGVTVPTIHNLFGKKRDVFERLVDQVTEWMLAFADAKLSANTLLEVEFGIKTLFDLIGEHETIFKAGYLIGERFGALGLGNSPYRNVTGSAIEKYKQFVDTGDFRGDLSPVNLAVLVNNQFRLQRSDWLAGRITFPQFRQRFFWSFYAIMLSDAGDELREPLLARIKKVEDAAKTARREQKAARENAAG